MSGGALGATRLLPHEFEALRRVIRQVAGIHLIESKQALVAGRLQRRLRELGIPTFSDYLRIVEDGANADERRELINCITTNTTSFFRESHHFELLRERVVPDIVERARAGGPRRIRIWSAACSTGQEPWSIAMTVAEALGSLAGWDVRILASDIDTRVLQKAERAVYDDELLESVPSGLRDRWFERAEGGRRVKGALRSLVAFRRMNLVAPSTWTIRTRFDVIFCRNVAIYFDRPTQDAMFTALAGLLEPTGYLLSGHAENLHWLSHILRPLGKTIHVPAAPSVTLPRSPDPILNEVVPPAVRPAALAKAEIAIQLAAASRARWER